jgi:hypothetical protein
MWELQPLSTNRRTTEISLLLGENTSLTLSQIPHNFVVLLFLSYSPLLLSCGVLKVWMHCLFIGNHPCKRQEAPIGAASGIELVPNIVDLGSTNCCPTGFTFSHLKTFDDLIKTSPLIICDSSILSILVIFMLLTILLGHKRICTIRTC